MRPRIALVIPAAVALASCATIEREEVAAPPQGGSVTMRTGTPLVVSLPPDPDTGYGWVLRSSSPNLLLVGGPDYTPQPKPAGLVGVADTTAYRFRAVRARAPRSLEFVWTAPPGSAPVPERVVRYDVQITSRIGLVTDFFGTVGHAERARRRLRPGERRRALEGQYGSQRSGWHDPVKSRKILVLLTEDPEKTWPNVPAPAATPSSGAACRRPSSACSSVRRRASSRCSRRSRRTSAQRRPPRPPLSVPQGVGAVILAAFFMPFAYYDQPLARPAGHLSPERRDRRARAARGHRGRAARPQHRRRARARPPRDRAEGLAAARSTRWSRGSPCRPSTCACWPCARRTSRASCTASTSPTRSCRVARISVWMRTAQKKQVVAFRSFLRTVVHEFLHHLDYEHFKLAETFHTEGFYKRESSLSQRALRRQRLPAARTPRTAESGRIAALPEERCNPRMRGPGSGFPHCNRAR